MFSQMQQFAQQTYTIIYIYLSHKRIRIVFNKFEAEKYIHVNPIYRSYNKKLPILSLKFLWNVSPRYFFVTE